MPLQIFPPSFITVLEASSVEMPLAPGSLTSGLIQQEMRGQEERELEAILLVPGPLVGQLPHSSEAPTMQLPPPDSGHFRLSPNFYQQSPS